MTTEQQAAQILIESLARVHSINLVLLTLVGCGAMAFLGWLVIRWIDRRDELNFYKSRDAEARELCSASCDTINRMAAEGRKQRNLLLDLDDYFRRHRAMFDDKEREPLVARIGEVIAERQPPLQIAFQRNRPAESEAA